MRGRDAGRPVIVGSVKTNIGHLEAAAGIAGVIKVALSLHHREIPPHLHLREPSPYIPWADMPVTVPTELTPWPSSDSHHGLAGVSSFGFSGTNAHVILEEAGDADREAVVSAPRARPADHVGGPGLATPEDETDLLLISARSPESLHDLADRYQSLLTEDSEVAWRDICFSAATRRTHHSHRLAVVARGRCEAAERLTGFRQADGERPGLRVDHVRDGKRPHTVFVYCGHGAEWAGMGMGLLESQPVFRAVLEQCDEFIQQYAGWSVLRELAAEESASRLGDTEILQPVLLSLQVGLTELWRSWGVIPDAVVGHSLGEVAAAYAAGGLTLEDALKVAVHRGRLMQPAKATGIMAVLGLPEDDVRRLLIARNDAISIAAVNSPRSTVISGGVTAVATVMAEAERCDHYARRLQGAEYPFHNSTMAVVRAPLIEALSDLKPRPPTIAMFSTVTGRRVEGKDLGAQHWGDGVVMPVRFIDAIRAAVETPATVLEVGPHPVLASAVTESLAGEDGQPVLVASMRKGQNDLACILDALGSLHVSGVEADHHGRYRHRTKWVQLPTYAWQRRRHWAPRDGAGPGGAGSPGAPAADLTRLFHRRFETVGPPKAHHFEVDLDPERFPWLADYRYCGLSVVPLGLLTDIALAVGREALGPHPVSLQALELKERLLPSGPTTAKLQLTLTLDEPGSASLKVWAFPADACDSGPIFCAEGRVVGDYGPPSGPPLQVSQQSQAGDDPSHLFEALENSGLQLGDAWRAVETLHRQADEVVATLRRPQRSVRESPTHLTHPVVSETAFHMLAAAMEDSREGRLLLPARIGRIRWYGSGDVTSVRVTRSAVEGGGVGGGIQLADKAGTVLAEMEGVQMEAVAPSESARWLRPLMAKLAYEIDWRRAESARADADRSVGDAAGSWLVFLDGSALARRVVAELRSGGERCRTMCAQRNTIDPEADLVVDPMDPESVRRAVMSLDGPNGPLQGVLGIWDWENYPDQVAEATTVSCELLLHLAQALAARKHPGSAPLWLVTRGVQPVVPGQVSIPPCGAGLWGLGRVIALEHPEVWGGLIDLDPRKSANEASLVTREILQPDGEDQVAYRGAERFVARLVRHTGLPHTADTADTISTDGTADAVPAAPTRQRPLAAPSFVARGDASYLVTGGRGALGLRVARWLADRGARHLILVGRRPLPDRSRWGDEELDPALRPVMDAIRALEERGIVVHTPAADVAEIEQMAPLIQGPEGRWPAVRGVVHAAGVFEPRSIQETGVDHLALQLRPKVQGTWVIHELTRHADLDFLVLFSSAASVWGSALAGSYVAGNHFEDLVAHYRRGLGLPALAINWGWWAGGGMASADVQRYFRTIGLQTLPSDIGLLALEDLLVSGAVQRTVAPVDWDRFRPVFEAKRRRPLLDLIDQPTVSRRARTGTPSDGSEFVRSVRAADPPRRKQLMTELLQGEVANLLGLAPGRRSIPASASSSLAWTRS